MPKFQDHARNLFLISFYFAGMRISDMLRLRWSDFRNDRLYYSMGKNTKAGSLKVPAKATAIIERYNMYEPVHDLVFPDLKSLPDLRHSFALIASDKIPVQILQKLYRHSSITTTIGYQSNFTTQHKDDALDKVIGN